jgi:hypothetical protein
MSDQRPSPFDPVVADHCPEPSPIPDVVSRVEEWPQSSVRPLVTRPNSTDARVADTAPVEGNILPQE